MRRVLSQAAFVAGLIACAALAVFTVLVWQGHFISGTASTGKPRPPVHASSERVPAGTEPVPQSPTKLAPVTAKVVLTAARGDCWMSVREGSSTGKVLYEGILAKGKTLRVTGKRVWLRLGAPGNVDITLNGKRRHLPAGTIEAVLAAEQAPAQA